MLRGKSGRATSAPYEPDLTEPDTHLRANATPPRGGRGRDALWPLRSRWQRHTLVLTGRPSAVRPKQSTALPPGRRSAQALSRYSARLVKPTITVSIQYWERVASLPSP